MTEHNRYEIGSLYDVARIPDEALPRFFAELPSIIETLRRSNELLEMIGLLGDVEYELQPPVWVDDGNQDKTLTLSLPDDVKIEIKESYNG